MKTTDRTDWLRALALEPRPHHNTQVRDLASFAKRQRERMRAVGWPTRERHDHA